jgi:predicted porin
VDAFNGVGMFGSPRIVFTGSEDLGGGLTAGFRLESTVDVISGRMGAATLGAQATTGPIFDRGAEVSLSGGFGTIAIGKLDHFGIENNDLNTVGNISLFNGTNVEANGVASDVNGSFRYTTPTFSGVRVHVGFTPKDNSNVNTVASSKAHGGITSYQVEGTLGDLRFRAGGGVVKTIQTGAATSATGDTDVMGFAVAYNLGVADVSVGYQTQDNPGTTADAKETIVSASVPLASGLSIRANYSTLDEDGNTAVDRKLYTVALVKALSKRTNVFFYHQDTGFGLASTAATADTSRTGLRVSHSF